MKYINQQFDNGKQIFYSITITLNSNFNLTHAQIFNALIQTSFPSLKNFFFLVFIAYFLQKKRYENCGKKNN